MFFYLKLGRLSCFLNLIEQHCEIVQLHYKMRLIQCGDTPTEFSRINQGRRVE